MPASPKRRSEREAELWRALDGVNDPELDEAVTAMGFVEQAVVAEDGHVEVDFRLPTYWCSPNFAFLMLDDIRTALIGLSWSPAFAIRLHDHMYAEEVNEGLAAGRSFDAIFGDLAGDQGLGGLRATFDMKAYKRRQEAVLQGLRAEGFSDRRMVAMPIGVLSALTFQDADAEREKSRYLAALAKRFGRRADTEPAFLTFEGQPILEAGLGDYLSDLRRLRINMEFSGALCRGLKASRYKEMEIVDGEPTLVDFMRGPVTPKQDAQRPD